MWLLIKDAWYTKSWKDKLRVWYKPPGWRPADVAEKFPVHKIEDVYDFEKYDTPYSKSFLAWTWFQTIVLLSFISYLFGNIAAIGSPGIFIYGAFAFLFVYAFTEMMDGSSHAYIWEILKAAMGIGLLFYTGDWFGISSIHPALKYFILIYFVVSLAVVLWFTYNNHRQEKNEYAVG